ncbi:hypothetical protein [Paenibacillus sp. QZ-Y1]|uniref:hypothetical protein n=1 Tax=Paenibacillus sp. QZ-Y1 TaxID=3414511 RepID=UPI003F790B24
MLELLQKFQNYKEELEIFIKENELEYTVNLKIQGKNGLPMGWKEQPSCLRNSEFASFIYSYNLYDYGEINLATLSKDKLK